MFDDLAKHLTDLENVVLEENIVLLASLHDAIPRKV